MCHAFVTTAEKGSDSWPAGDLGGAPAGLRRRLAGDLDNIVLKALLKGIMEVVFQGTRHIDDVTKVKEYGEAGRPRVLDR